MFRYSTIITSRYEAISLLPFLGEKHICILFFINTIMLDSGINRNTKLHYTKKLKLYSTV